MSEDEQTDWTSCIVLLIGLGVPVLIIVVFAVTPLGGWTVNP